MTEREIPVHAQLSGVPETALWTLRNRAEEALRADSGFADAEAVRLYRRLGGEDFERFGPPSQVHALRAQVIDTVIAEFLGSHPGAPVVALGEGLQTTYWRLGEPESAWYSIELPEMIDAQERLLPAAPGITRLAYSALDRQWLEKVPSGPAVITAEGLFMYLPTADVHALIADLAAHFPGGVLVYDSIPRLFSAMTRTGRVRLSDRYTAPPMPTSQSPRQARRLPGRIPGVVAAQDLLPPRGRGRWGSPVLRWAADTPIGHALRPSITLLRFAQ
ncbi:class I SAM-dependent methyltransferase [Nocardia sp. CDC153]|uniref:class I SAM-dependent methyltransferase n=1 Tax=Nocardia sp. CDC153 TaxID=3112167 RepID=UPI002DBA4E69|nr:class I SAM-dependent methyltransferase [Nocardia sp. CDC153]MEC3956250.1 class I SAM-dependent methyltransferase [Nocardia sp. CDC153]